MAEERRFTFTHRQLAEILVKQEGIKEGHWGLDVEFGIVGASMSFPQTDGQMVPAAIVPILEIRLKEFDEANSLTVDAREVNPPNKQGAKSPKSRKKAGG